MREGHLQDSFMMSLPDYAFRLLGRVQSMLDMDIHQLREARMASIPKGLAPESVSSTASSVSMVRGKKVSEKPSARKADRDLPALSPHT